MSHVKTGAIRQPETASCQKCFWLCGNIGYFLPKSRVCEYVTNVITVWARRKIVHVFENDETYTVLQLIDNYKNCA